MSQDQSTNERVAQTLWKRQRLCVARALTRFAKWVSPELAPVAPAPERQPFISRRAEVRAWVTQANPELLRELELDPVHGGRFEAILHGLPYLPSEDVVYDFLSLTPGWRDLHPKHASVLLKRLCSCRYQRRDYDATQYTQVMEFFLNLKRLIHAPPHWAEAVQHAKLLSTPSR